MGKYEEALERARQGKPIDEVFPELKESEDERIRKALVKEFKEKVQKSFVWKGIPNNAILNWLEKQKDTTSVLSLQQAYREGFDNAIKAVKQNPERYGFPKEQNLVQDKEEKEYVRTLKSLIADFLRGKDEVDRIYYQRIYDWLEGRHIEQKPSTPKFRVGDVMRTKREAAEGITDGLPVIVSVDDNNYNCTNELISISDQEEYEFPPMNRRQKSEGWSDEDVKMIGIAISFVQAASCNSILGVDKLDVIAWLKALRSGILNGNSHRKPSEEQITL